MTKPFGNGTPRPESCSLLFARTRSPYGVWQSRPIAASVCRAATIRRSACGTCISGLLKNGDWLRPIHGNLRKFGVSQGACLGGGEDVQGPFRKSFLTPFLLMKIILTMFGVLILCSSCGSNPNPNPPPYSRIPQADPQD